eukprot:476918-Pelagomonas_calceolata.AAC.2
MAEQQQPLGESFPSSGECDARLYDDLSQYVATPRFLKAFETHGQPSAAAETHGEDGGDTNDVSVNTQFSRFLSWMPGLLYLALSRQATFTHMC